MVLPFLVNLVRTYAWVAILSDEGLVNGILMDIGVTDTGVQFVNTSWAVIGGLVYGYLAFMILPLYAALDRMDPSLIEAGKDLYGSRWQTFWHVTGLPGRGGRLWIFLPAVGDFIAQLLGGPDTYMVGNLIQQQFLEAANWPFGAALTIVMMAFLLLWMLIYLRSAARRLPGGHGVSAEGWAARLPLGRRRGGRRRRRDFDRPRFLRVFFYVFAFFTFAPLVIVALFSLHSLAGTSPASASSGTTSSSAAWACVSR